jgi:hypothetical protein
MSRILERWFWALIGMDGCDCLLSDSIQCRVQEHVILGTWGFSSLSTRTECEREPETEEELKSAEVRGENTQRIYFSQTTYEKYSTQ